MVRLLLRFSALFLLLPSAASLAAAPTKSSLPLVFEQNRGQAGGEYAFLFRQNGTEALFRASGVDLQFTGSKQARPAHLGLRLLGQAEGVAPRAEEPLESQTNYLMGADPTRWIRHVPNFARVRYDAVYPGIDLVFYGNEGRLEHDFRVRPGADARRIAFRLDGADGVQTTAGGDLRIATGGDTLVLQHPVAYQVGSVGRTAVPAAFTVAQDGTIAFAVGAYDHSRELVIDPALSYATYLDALPVGVSGLATDSTGATYITGYTFFSTYGVTAGAFQTTCAACANHKPAAYVTKLDPAGKHVIYATFLGGSDYTQPFALAVDANGDAIVGGYTNAVDYPVKNPLPNGSLSGPGQYGFVTSLSPDGSALNFSSLLNNSSIVNAVAAGPSGNVFLSGQANSVNFPVTPGALDNLTLSYTASYAFVTQLTPAGALVYSALVGNVNPQNGGAGLIGVLGMTVDSQGEAYITGAAGTLWPITAGAYQATIPGQMPYSAPFVTKLSADGSQLVFSTFVGFGEGLGIALEGNGVVDLLSSTGESAATYSAYLSRLSADGSQLLHSTTLGSGSGSANTNSTPTVLTRDSAGNLWIAGTTNDDNYPLLHPLQGLGPGFEDVLGFVSEYDPTATTLKFSTFYNGIYGGLTGLAVDASGTVHLAGTTIDPIYTTPGALVPTVTAPPQNVTYTYGYLALIDTTQASSAVCAQPFSGQFVTAPVGTPGTSQIVLTNCGDLPLTITSIQSSSSVFTAPDAASACGSSVAPGASCTITVTFAPVQPGSASGTLTVESNASIPVTTFALSGMGLNALPTLSSSALSFTTAPGTPSATQTVTLTNVSGSQLTVGVIQVTQPFTVTNNCPNFLAAGAACTITVGFNSATAGTFSGALEVDDSYMYQGQSQTATLSGTAANPAVSVGAAPSGSTAQTVTAGQPATFALVTSSVGNFSGMAALSCTNLPQYATCTFSPATIALTAGASTPVNLTITTEQTATASVRGEPAGRGLLALALLGLPVLWVARRRVASLRGARLLMAGLLVFGLSAAGGLLGCSGSSGSGGGSTPPTPSPSLTPAGTYTVTVVATSSVATASLPVTLVVQ